MDGAAGELHKRAQKQNNNNNSTNIMDSTENSSSSRRCALSRRAIFARSEIEKSSEAVNFVRELSVRDLISKCSFSSFNFVAEKIFHL